MLLYHADLPWVPGGFVGVDVFFVISGFLITQGLVRELAANGRISLSGFYARRVRRILPAATVTLLSVVALTVLLLPRTRWLQLGQDVIASAAYFINWDLADRSVDYLARTQAPSPEVAAARGQPSVHVLDLTDWICPTEECAMVIGGALVFRDDSHLTATYSRSLSGVLGARLADVLAEGR